MSKSLRAVAILLVSVIARGVAASSLTVTDYSVASDGVSTFDVLADASLPSFGRVEVVKIDVVAPEFTSRVYESGVLVESAVSAPEIWCAHAGYSVSSTVSLVSCGSTGPSITFIMPNGATYVARKNDGELGDVAGTYSVESVVGKTADGTVDGTLGSSIDVELPYTRLTAFRSTDTDSSSVLRRRRLLQSSTQRVTFDYVFVSDHKRYANYGGDLDAILADTVAEIAAANAIFLVQDKFTPQIQFRMLHHITWTTLDPIMTQTNVESGPYDQDGAPTTYVDLHRYLDDFGKYAFHISEWNLDTRTQVTGPMATIGNNAHGWHLLTGYHGGEGIVGLANINATCYGFEDSVYRSACASIMTGSSYAYEQFYLGQISTSDAEGPNYCVPNMNYGVTSTLNTPTHYFPGLILAHELGHNIGFDHVYNGGDSSGNVDNCMGTHSGNVVMGHDGQVTEATWSDCSVIKFTQQWNSPTNQNGASVPEGGLYSCAADNFDTTKLPATTNTFSAFPTAELYHHLNATQPSVDSHPPSPSPPPGSPNPPMAPIPADHKVTTYTVTIASTLTDEQKTTLKDFMSRPDNIHNVV